MQNASQKPLDPETDRDLVRRLGACGSAFFGAFESLRPGQREAVAPILNGRNTLVAASTASGKTEAVLAPLIARLLAKSAQSQRTRVLVITPTRALVNDLRRRISTPLATLGWTCGAQTSDHRQRESQPHLLITTPESFDSTLNAGFVEDRPGNPYDHWLATVEAIFLDECHFYYGSPRGDQILFLIQRLQRLRRWAREKGVTTDAEMQICGASATVGEVARVAQWLLGPHAHVVQSSEARTIELLTSEKKWLPCDKSCEPRLLEPLLLRLDASTDLGQFVLDQKSSSAFSKWLIFVPSRRVCDEVAHSLREYLRPKSDIWVGAHHSSLSREQREDGEAAFARNRAAVMVATSTLEVGIDIGDVDVVCQIGCPGSVANLLQRIGRGNRRERDRTRLVAMPRNNLESAAFAGLVVAGVRGEVENPTPRRFWSVFVQQTLSFMRQNRGNGRTKASLVELATAAWPLPDTAERAGRLIDRIVDTGVFEYRRGKLFPSRAIDERCSEGGALFANFDTTSSGVSVVDQASGQVLANVSAFSIPTGALLVGGRAVRVVTSNDRIVEVAASPSGAIGRPSSLQYSSKRMPVREDFAGAVRSACGFSAADAPLLMAANRLSWFHFGGEIWERLARDLFPPHAFVRVLIPGIALETTLDHPQLREEMNISPDAVKSAVSRIWRSLASVIEKGRFFQELPSSEQENAVCELIDADHWSSWARARMVSLVHPEDPRFAHLDRLSQE